MTDAAPYPLPEDDEVISALDGTGFLLEQRVAQVFLRHQMITTTNYAFQDSETAKSREVDLRCIYIRFVEGLEVYPLLEATIAVECKNTNNPFVLIGSSKNRIYIRNESFFKSTFDPLSLGFPNRTCTYDELGFDKLEGNPNVEQFSGNQIVRMHLQSGKWRADNSGVYDSIVTR